MSNNLENLFDRVTLALESVAVDLMDTLEDLNLEIHNIKETLEERHGYVTDLEHRVSDLEMEEALGA